MTDARPTPKRKHNGAARTAIRNAKPQAKPSTDVGLTSTGQLDSRATPLERRSVRLICAAVVFTVTLGVYIQTLAPTVTLVDSGELIVAARYLGVAHPPGTPLYIMLAHLATLLPIGSIALRVNLASALFAALASALASLALAELLITPAPARAKAIARLKSPKRRKEDLRVTERPLPGLYSYIACVSPPIVTGLLAGFSRTLWAYGTLTEVYTLNAMLIVLIFFLMIRWRRGIIEREARLACDTPGDTQPAGGDRPLYLAALVFGLAMGVHHVTVGLTLAGLAVFVLIIEGFAFFKSKRLLYAAIVSVAGLIVVYSYLPIAASRSTVANWGNPTNLKRIWQHVSGWQYREFLKFSGSQIGTLAGEFFKLVAREFGPPWLPIVLILGITGMAALAHSRKWDMFFFLLLIQAADLAYCLSYGIDEDKDAYYLPLFLTIALAAGLGVATMLRLMAVRIRSNPQAIALGAAVMLVGPLVPFSGNLKYNNRRNYYIAHDYVDNILQTVGNLGMLLTTDWQVYSPMTYVREVELRRRDVVALDLNLLRHSWYYPNLEREYPELFQHSRSEVDAFLEDLRGWENDQVTYDTDPVLNRRINTRFTQMILAFVADRVKSAEVDLTEDMALDFGQQNPELVRSLTATYQLVPNGLVFRLVPDRNFHEPASPRLVTRGLFDGSIAFDPDDVVEHKVVPAYLNMLVNRGRYLAAHGRHTEAIEAFEEALHFKADYPPAVDSLQQSQSALTNPGGGGPG
ncbi:MAG TPA: DUF2723 domain-containing protein [Blastocatellia bacterium]|nr:DUF2723 domain-containing protein [Blastocatellia bacterium]